MIKRFLHGTNDKFEFIGVFPQKNCRDRASMDFQSSTVRKIYKTHPSLANNLFLCRQMPAGPSRTPVPTNIKGVCIKMFANSSITQDLKSSTILRNLAIEKTTAKCGRF